jgi:hypothetical protein
MSKPALLPSQQPCVPQSQPTLLRQSEPSTLPPLLNLTSPARGITTWEKEVPVNWTAKLQPLEPRLNTTYIGAQQLPREKRENQLYNGFSLSSTRTAGNEFSYEQHRRLLYHNVVHTTLKPS